VKRHEWEGVGTGSFGPTQSQTNRFYGSQNGPQGVKPHRGKTVYKKD
jgi:hypothetical protein